MVHKVGLAHHLLLKGRNWDGWSGVCFVGLSNLSLSVVFLLSFGGVPVVWFWRCSGDGGVLVVEVFRWCGV